MVFVSNVKYCEAECGEHIDNFINELLEYRKESKLDVIAKFNDIYVKVSMNTKKDDIYQVLKGGAENG